MTDVLSKTGPGGPEMGQEHCAVDNVEPLTSPALTAGDFSLSLAERLATLKPSAILERKVMDRLHDENGELKLYDPVIGALEFDKTKPLEGCEVDIFSYYSPRSSRRVGVYRPDDFDPKAENPTVLIQTPLGTGVKGHNQEVARQFAEMGFLTVVVGPPRYYDATLSANGIIEDANEAFGVINTLNEIGQDRYGKLEELILYGESQGAMKLLAELAMIEEYGYYTVDGLAVAPCYLRLIHLERPDKQVRRLFGMAKGVISFVANSSADQRQYLKGTFSPKDIHHHAIVPPVLASGETGYVLDYIDPDIDISVRLFGKDGNSKPHRSKAEFDGRFANVDTTIDPRYGHVDGIMSWDTRVQRELMLFEAAKKFDMRSAVKLELALEEIHNQAV